MNVGRGITDLMSRVVKATTEASEPAAEVTLPGVPESVSAARRLVRDALHDSPRLDDLVLATSELVSNALAHSASSHGGAIVVRVSTISRWARIEVTDDGPAFQPPVRRNGWGLTIVKAVTDRSGATIEPDGRRKAWAEVTWSPR